MSKLKICILGGTGFVGRRIVAYLVDQGHQAWIVSRRRSRHRDLLVLPTVQVVEGDVHNSVFLHRQFEGMDAVVNLIGILNETGRSGRGFTKVHAELPAKVVEACRLTGVRRLLHMSALHASLSGPSHYLRTKAMGEEAVHRAASEDFRVTSFRPSVIFGPRDSFTNRFAQLLRWSPGVFPLACPDARFQPVYVDDVARAFVGALENHQTFGQRYNLCGPKVYSLQDIVRYIARLIGRRTYIVRLNDALSMLQAAMLEYFPGKPFSLDNYRSLQVDSVCPGSEAERKKVWRDIFAIDLVHLEQTAPGYLSHRHVYRRNPGVPALAGRG
jgi:uncharacterized protein YbjT (DUF2867 family)